MIFYSSRSLMSLLDCFCATMTIGTCLNAETFPGYTSLFYCLVSTFLIFDSSSWVFGLLSLFSLYSFIWSSWSYIFLRSSPLFSWNFIWPAASGIFCITMGYRLLFSTFLAISYVFSPMLLGTSWMFFLGRDMGL
jgi:hypothetical protein